MIKKYGEFTDLSLVRLVNNQKLELDLLVHYINNNLYDKNDYFNQIQKILIINKVIKDKLSSVENIKKYKNVI